jgi:hypothetical protein
MQTSEVAVQHSISTHRRLYLTMSVLCICQDEEEEEAKAKASRTLTATQGARLLEKNADGLRFYSNTVSNFKVLVQKWKGWG